MDPSLLALIDDASRLDVAAAAGELAGHLAAAVEQPTRVEARAAFDAGSTRLPELVALGRPGLGVATAALLERLPSQRAMPWPPFERWDAIVELHVDRPETVWLVADVFAALTPSQASLARRTLYGVQRRFGARGFEVLTRRAGTGPHAALIARASSSAGLG